MNNEKKPALSKAEGLIPKLRFPEFGKDGEWQEEILEDVLDYERPDEYIVTDTNYQNEGTPVLTANKSFVLGYTKEKVGIYNNLPAIIFDDFTVDSKYVDFPFKVKSSAIKILTPRKEDDLKFVFELISQIKFNAKEHKRYYISEFQKLKIPIPKPQEQQKIASCLSSLDEVIAAHSQKMELLKDHKKGLMQNLFPSPSAGSGKGKKVPNFRFKEFEKDGDWVQTYVEENCLVKGRIGYRGYTTEDLVGRGEGALVLGGKHIQNQVLELRDPTYLSWQKFYESPEIMVEIGDIIFSQRGTLGDCAIIEKEIGPATINPSMVLLKNITCNPKFMYYILTGDHIQNEVQKNKALGAIPMLSQKQIKEFPFLIPDNPKEQQKIASCLSSLDDVITAQADKIEQLKQHKKGLMQGLFPKLND
jgi:type I restriction enzyme, S subunit